MDRKRCSACLRMLSVEEFSVRSDRGTPEKPSYLSKCHRCQRQYMKHYMRKRRGSKAG